MHKPATIFILIAAALWLVACGDETTTSVNSNQPLGVLYLSPAGGSSATSSSVIISLEIEEPPVPKTGLATIDLLVQSITVADEGTTRYIAASDLDPVAVGQLTNGVDNFMWIRTTIPGGGSGASGADESYWFEGGLTGKFDPDFNGARITGFYIHFDSISITNAENEYGKTTSYDLDYRVVVMGVPGN